MSEASPLRMVALVAEQQRPAITAAAEQLSSCIGQAVGQVCQIAVAFAARDETLPPSGFVLVASLVDDVHSGLGMDEVERQWRGRLSRLQNEGYERVMLCTLFRHVGRGDGRSETLERIRRLNQLIVALSHEVGSEIADIDRFLALCGARTLDADYRCSSPRAVQLAGHAITAAILDGEIAGHLSPEAQQRAIALHGGVQNMPQLFARYISKGTGR